MAKGGGRRTYVRDNRGRFASTPGGGGSPKRPATKPVKRGPNRLTRDNAGRITSVGGDGATVRGGRLKTAAGNLRSRQVAKLKTMQGVSYEKPARKPRSNKSTATTPAATTKNASNNKNVTTKKGSKKPAKKAREAIPKNLLSSSFRPGEFYRGNFRPRYVTGKPQKSPKIYGTNKDDNIEVTLGLASKTKRFRLANLQKKKGNVVASVSFPPPANTPNLNINTSNKWYKNPTKEQREWRRSGFISTSDPRGVVFHEAAHAKYGHRGKQRWPGGKNSGFGMIAKRVSQYAATNPNEFVAEVYAGRKTGRKYDHQVMGTFRLYTKSVYEKKGGSPLLIKNQKPIRRKRKP